MRPPAWLVALGTSPILFALSSCTAPPAHHDEDVGTVDDAFASREAVLLDFEFDGELTTDSDLRAPQAIQDQLLYTIGHLNAERSVGRLDRLTLSNVVTAAEPDGSTFRVSYHARMPVAWGRRSAIPASYTFSLPKVVSWTALASFATKYGTTCVDHAAHDVDAGSIWYYYRPTRAGCALDAADIVTATATATTSVENTTSKYPEYSAVWADDELKVVAIFGKNEDGATASHDAGIAAYDEFIASMQAALSPYAPTTIPTTFSTPPGIGAPDITFSGTLADGKRVTVTALLVDNVRTAGPAFDARYAALSSSADVIAYNGHAGLGQNVRALARKGTWSPGKYLLLFMNGCDTFAYVDGYLAQTRATINPDDPTGTKYMDIVTNAMPSYFSSNSEATTAVVRGLLSVHAPLTFEQTFSSIDRAQVVLVTGEEDNAFTPGAPVGTPVPPSPWSGLTESGTVAAAEQRWWHSPVVAPGAYTFTMTGTEDADLYVRVGAPPSLREWNCRPYASGSSETCRVSVDTPAPIYVMVRGWAPSSSFTLTATP